MIQRYAFPKAGRVVSIAGDEEARKIAGVTDVVVTAKPGDIIPAGRRQAAVRRHGADDRRVARRRRCAAANDALACLKIATA